jgi:endonuclease/exonuclease/phosphatase (EEP) superfamily protein YafD
VGVRLTDVVSEQIETTYRRMDAEARYRPCAPGDGMGNIVVPLEELDIEAEAREYADAWWAEEDDGSFYVGCCDHLTRPATIFAMEAARCLCGADPETAARLLRLAAEEVERALPA